MIERARKPYVPWAWTPALVAAGMTPAQRSAVIYACSGAWWDRDAEAWLTLWCVQTIAERSGVDRQSVMAAKKKLIQAGLATEFAPASRRNEKAATIDVTKLMEVSDGS